MTGFARRSVRVALVAAVGAPIACHPSRQELIRSGAAGSVPREAPFHPEPSSGASGASVDRLLDPCRGLPLPVDQHYVPPGLCARAIATKQGPVRELTFAPNGDLIAVTRTGTIRRYRDTNGNGVFDPGTGEIVDWASTGGDNGQNCHLDGEWLYCGSKEGVKRWRYRPDVDHGGEGQDVMIGQPGGGNHPFHPLHVYDGEMYVDSGSERNTIAPMPEDYITDRAVIKRFDLRRFTPKTPFRWADGEVLVRGARNVTGFARDPKGNLYGVVNGVDDLRYEGQDVHADNQASTSSSSRRGRRTAGLFALRPSAWSSAGRWCGPGRPSTPMRTGTSRPRGSSRATRTTRGARRT
jgi:hypothetical protein